MGDDAERLIASIINAARTALEGPHVLKKSQSDIERWKQTKRHAEALHRLLMRRAKSIGIVEFHAREVIPPLSGLLKAIEVFKLGERDPSELAAALGLSREFRTARFTRTIFMKFIGKEINDICGKPLRKAVALLTEIVLRTARPSIKRAVRGARPSDPSVVVTDDPLGLIF